MSRSAAKHVHRATAAAVLGVAGDGPGTGEEVGLLVAMSIVDRGVQGAARALGWADGDRADDRAPGEGEPLVGSQKRSSGRA